MVSDEPLWSRSVTSDMTSPVTSVMTSVVTSSVTSVSSPFSNSTTATSDQKIKNNEFKKKNHWNISVSITGICQY